MFQKCMVNYSANSMKPTLELRMSVFTVCLAKTSLKPQMFEDNLLVDVAFPPTRNRAALAKLSNSHPEHPWKHRLNSAPKIVSCMAPIIQDSQQQNKNTNNR